MTDFRKLAPDQRWELDEIQFPRLLAEIIANVQFTRDQWNTLKREMDLSGELLDELFERAQAKWDAIKADL